MRRRFSLLVAVIAALSALVGATSAQAAARHRSSARAADGSGINWGPCTDPNLVADNAQCALVPVPLDYSNPSGAKIDIAVSIIRHTSKNYQGVIFTNPGGPGGSGLNLNTFLIPVLKAEGFEHAAEDYDWIGFDPRGVGSSVPAITCMPDFLGPDRPNYNPTSSSILGYWLQKVAAYAQKCDSHSAAQSALLRHITTPDVARDIDYIRELLGQKQINYYGFSYGTDLGQVYATLFPSHVRRIILDSNVNMTRPGYDTTNLDQDGPFDRNENIWFGWLAKYNSVYHLGSTQSAVRTLFYKTMDQLQKAPIEGIVGPDEWTDVFQQAGYYEETWLGTAQLFSDWINKHNTDAANALVAAYEGSDAPGNDNSIAVYLAVQCTDSQWPHDFSTWSTDTWNVFHTAPFLAWPNTWFNGPCLDWKAPSSTLTHVGTSQISNMLLIDETLDAATPFQGSLVTRQLFPNSVLLAEPGGTTHADSLFGDYCVDSTIGNYLQTGDLPPRDSGAEWDKTCAPLPMPVPAGASGAAVHASATRASAARSSALRVAVKRLARRLQQVRVRG